MTTTVLHERVAATDHRRAIALRRRAFGYFRRPVRDKHTEASRLPAPPTPVESGQAGSSSPR